MKRLYSVPNPVDAPKWRLIRPFFDRENEYKAVSSPRYAEKQPFFSRLGAVNTVGDTIKRLCRRVPLCILFCILTSPLGAIPPIWVSRGGLDPRYPSQTYLTGFAQVSPRTSDGPAVVKDKALADMAAQISVKIKSELILKETDANGRHKASADSFLSSSVDAQISGSRFETYEDGNSYFALAYVSRQSLLDKYAGDAANIYGTLVSRMNEAQGRNDRELRSLLTAGTLLSELHDLRRQYQGVNPGFSDSGFFSGMEAKTIEDVRAVERELQRRLDAVGSRRSSTLDEAVGLLALLLARQDGPAGRLSVSAFQYGGTDFSSEFGRYVASRLESELIGALGAGQDKDIDSESAAGVIVQGRCWEEEDNTIRLQTIALALPAGRKIARADAGIPASQTAGRELKPQNLEQALIDMRQFAEGAVTDGGISVNLWTNKPADDILTFTEGEELTIYLQVNRPAFVELTYIIASGERVLLTPAAHYIGIDKVNRPVDIFPRFEVVPPFGAEQLIVTAYSTQPPVPQTVPRRIDGETYQVFPSVEKVVANTRGLRAKQQEEPEVLVGEARVSLTTLEER